MLFIYQTINAEGKRNSGTIEAINVDVALTALQRRGLTVLAIKEAKEESVWSANLNFFERVSNKDIVILSRQMATLFEAQVSALQIFKLLGAESEKAKLRKVLIQIADDLQSGSSISRALARHPKIFSDFYVSMIKAGEESGKLDQTFTALADYLERTYEVTSKAKNALIYPAFVIITFVAVMILMLTKVIPNISAILVESGQEIPFYTKAVLALSAFFVNYGLFLFILLVIGGFLLFRYARTESGRVALSKFRLSVPYIGELYRKLFLSRIASNLNTMLVSAIPMVKAIEITGEVVDDAVYGTVLRNAAESIKAGTTLSTAFGRHEEIPGIFIQMIRVGEESGELGAILKTLSRFYEREVINAVDTLVSLIEPVMIVLLGLGVGFLLASVLIPIYNISAGIS
jgi:type IV pilus assembly protein PilC